VILNIVAAAVVTTFNSITGADCISSSGWNVFKIISIIGSAVVGIVTVFGGVKNYGSRATAHQVAEGNYQALFYTIKRQLHMDRNQRQNGKDFLEWIQKEYTDLTSNISSPDIPDFVVKKYQNQVDGTSIAKYNDIEAINIKEESPKKNPSKMSLVITDQPQQHQKPARRYTTGGGGDGGGRNKHKYPKKHTAPSIIYPITDEEDESFGSQSIDNTPELDADYVVTIPSQQQQNQLSSKDKWQLERFYRDQNNKKST
jgi:hypothetical protein